MKHRFLRLDAAQWSGDAEEGDTTREEVIDWSLFMKLAYG